MPNGFTVNAHRFDLYKNFKFQVYVEGKLVMGVSKVGALKRTTEVVSYRSGGGNTFDFKSPGAHQVRVHHARTRNHPRP
jgi:phage tail-like protein